MAAGLKKMLSVAITEHPSRQYMSPILKENLDIDERSIETVIDWHSEGPWANYQRCLEAFSPDATHHLILEDDALPCKDLLAGVELFLDHVPPGCIVSIFKDFALTKNAMKAGKSWAVNQRTSAQGIVFPIDMVGEIAKWNNQHISSNKLVADTRVELYAYCNNIEIWHTVPSLVEHMGVNSRASGPSSPEVKSSGQAACFLGFDESALNVDWSKGASNPYRHDSKVVLEDWTTRYVY